MKAWAIVYDDKVIFETARRTRRECISAFMQDRDIDAVKWSDRYSARTRWRARQIEINVILGKDQKSDVLEAENERLRNTLKEVE